MPGPKNNPPSDAGSRAIAAENAPAASDPGRDYLQGVYNATHAPDTSGLTGISADAAKYPAFAQLMGVPEVADLLHQASVEGWSNDQFTLHLYATNWWKTHSATERDWITMQLIDPAKAAQAKRDTFSQISTEATLLGVPLDTNQLNFITEGAIAGGWTSEQIKQALAGNAQYNKDQPGQITATQTSLQGIAGAYGVPISPQTTFDWARRIAQGTADQNGFSEYAKNQAKLSHPYWEKQLDQGMTVRQLADPYIQQASKLLEISPDQVDLTNSKWRFTAPDKQGQQQPMSQLDWERKIMSDPAYGWGRTQNARDSAFQMVDSLRQSFGAA